MNAPSIIPMIGAAFAAAGLIHGLQKDQRVWAPIMGALLILNFMRYLAIIH